MMELKKKRRSGLSTNRSSPLSEATRAVQVKLTPSERRYLDDLVAEGRYDSRSGALRAGLAELMRKHGLSPDLERALELERRWHQPRRGPGV